MVRRSSRAVQRSSSAVRRSSGALRSLSGAVWRSSGALRSLSGAIRRSSGMVRWSSGAFAVCWRELLTELTLSLQRSHALSFLIFNFFSFFWTSVYKVQLMGQRNGNKKKIPQWGPKPARKKWTNSCCGIPIGARDTAAPACLKFSTEKYEQKRPLAFSH